MATPVRTPTTAGQISRYENGKITPSVEAIVKFAELFDVSVVDYVLVEDATRRPFRQSQVELGTRLADLDQLSDADRAALLHIRDGLLANPPSTAQRRLTGFYDCSSGAFNLDQGRSTARRRREQREQGSPQHPEQPLHSRPSR